MLRLRTLGGLALERDGVSLDGAATQRRRLALLALLASSDAGMTRERLASYLWPDADPARSRHSVDDALSALRRALRSDELFVGVATIRLNPAVLTTDLAQHAAAMRAGDGDRALALYAGPFLDGFSVPGAEEFERWVEEERARRAQSHARQLDRLAAAAQERGDLTAAVHWLRARVATDALDSSATLRLVTLLARIGNASDALRMARVHEALLREELECSPGPEWAAAIEGIRLALASSPEGATTVATPAPPNAPTRAPEGSTSLDLAASPAEERSRAIGTGKDMSARTPGPTRLLVRRDRRTRVAIGALALGLGSLVAGMVVKPRAGAVAGTRAAQRENRVLVVPLRNATGDSTLAPFGRMSADWIAQGLAQVNGVEVTADLTRDASVTDAELRTVATERQAATVVSGAYYADGDSIRLQLRVTDVAAWTLRGGFAPLSAPRTSPTRLLEPLRQRVMVALALAHDPRYAPFAGGAVPPTYDAYEQYLEGTAHFEQGDWATALPFYARAAALDSSYVQPLLGSADGEMNLGHLAAADSFVRRLEDRRATLTPADRGSVQRLRGEIDGDVATALAGARLAANASPGAQLPRFLHAVTALHAGYPREALEAAAPIASSFGGSRSTWTGGVYWSIVTSAHHMLHDYEGELTAAREGRAFHPDNPDIRAYELRALAALGRVDSLRPGIADLESMPRTPGSASPMALLIVVALELEAHGKHDEAATVLQRAIDAGGATARAGHFTMATRVDVARATYLSGRFADAGRAFASLAAERPADPYLVGYAALAAAHDGRRIEALRIAHRLASMRAPYDAGRTTYARARLAMALGDRRAALTLLGQAMREGVPYNTALHVDPELAPLRGDPAFETMLRGHR